MLKFEFKNLIFGIQIFSVFREPQIAFNQRIEWCLDLHNQSVSWLPVSVGERERERGGKIRRYPPHAGIFLTRASPHYSDSLMTWVVKIIAQDRYGVHSCVHGCIVFLISAGGFF